MYSASAMLAKTALKIKIPPLPPIPMLEIKDDITAATSMTSSSIKCKPGVSNRKMRPTKTKTGYNLCAWRWLTQVNEHGLSKEFREYWNKQLDEKQRDAYKKEANEQTAWSGDTFRRGTLY
ncbi:hypothetical protein PAXRUDRAFT_19891 [Paxillus rubicundulus Ve08.2h10]|uniref:Uncharacterized protein n=1 Tax=Paxillus rubicundulus Ve08.2h10 TaxID=930991 RepID=A0A0D0BSM3_9AGAM|nr:hypothetical protein PAXRUDRAFT_19891 [Paxillus rubicundulus Ve08.2h10]